MVKTARFEIIKPVDCSWEEFGGVLRELQYDTRRLLNRTVQMAWEYNQFSLQYKQEHGNYPKTEDILGYKTLDGFIYDKLKYEFNKFNSANFITAIKLACDKFKDSTIEILRGNMSIPSYTKGQPIDLHNKAFALKSDNKQHCLELALISRAYAKQLNRKSTQRFVCVLTNKNKSGNIIIDRIISGEYKQCASKIVKKENKWFLLLSYNFDVKKQKLNPDNVMGIDMGIKCPVYIGFNNNESKYYIEGGEIESFRIKTEKRRNQLKAQTKFCGEGHIGHGRDKRLEYAKKIGDVVSNFRDTVNHRYSKYIVDLAVKHGCATIQMEDLSGINTRSAFLKNWSYFDLQQKIIYKAKEKGIKVLKVNPKYTSQTCSKCGNIDENNRPNQATFHCTKCGYHKNADYNAAINIARSTNYKVEKDK